jgi:hypothetical protein
MPAKSEKQRRYMAMAYNDPEMGIPKEVAKKYMKKPAKGYKKGGMPKDPGEIKKDPKPPRKMGGEKFFQHPFKRRISNKLGTTELPVGEQVPDRIRPAGSIYQSGNLDNRFKAGGKVGYHKMPDGTMMKDSEHKGMKRGGKVRGCGMARGGAVRPCKIVKMKGS